MRVVTDQMQRTLQVPDEPKRIVSLVPSQTELLYALGLDEEVVGQTLFCIHPADKHQSKPRIGGTKKLKLDKIRELQPDLIIGNKEENERSQIEELEKEFPVWMSDIHQLNDALEMIKRVGDLTGKIPEATQISEAIHKQFQELKTSEMPLHVLYLIWRDPFMAAANDTFIGSMITAAGWENVMPAHLYNRYPQLTPADISALDPDVILLSSEPYPFKEEHMHELKMICPGARLLLVDGELFSWYGNRLLHTVDYLKELNRQLAIS
jgi:ABC-type Fe3+-hydroxamate transport system substrate-binding protein